MARLFLLLMAVSFMIYLTCYGWMLVDMILNPSLGWISISIASYIFILGFVALLYVIATRIKLPYDDYSSNHELELLQQFDEAGAERRRSELYGSIAALRIRLERQGYIHPINSPPAKGS